MPPDERGSLYPAVLENGMPNLNYSTLFPLPNDRLSLDGWRYLADDAQWLAGNLRVNGGFSLTVPTPLRFVGDCRIDAIGKEIGDDNPTLFGIVPVSGEYPLNVR